MTSNGKVKSSGEDKPIILTNKGTALEETSTSVMSG